MRILERPKIPNGLREAAARGTLIPFVGAGASRIAGSPGWDDFADQVLQQLVNGGGLTYRQLDQLKRELPRVKLSIAENIAAKAGIKVDYKRILHPSSANEPNGRRLYAAISRLSKVFITTNYDDWLDRKYSHFEDNENTDASSKAGTLERQVICRPEDFLISRLSPGNNETVIHLHGSITDPTSMALTTGDYMSLYASDRSATTAEEENRLLTLLEFLFRERTILFIGYSLSELEMLEYAILKSKDPTNKEVRHYMLSGFFSHEHDLASTMSDYWFENAATTLIPYSRDAKDWAQLIDVCEYIANEVTGLPGAASLERKRTMEALIND